MAANPTRHTTAQWSRATAVLVAALLVAVAATSEAQAGWRKPFSKGGALSINKVHVPKPLRIGRVEGIPEVLFPVCWGRPQECRGNPQTPPAKRVAQAPYYVTAEFTCMSRRTGMPTGGSCTVTVHSADSCQDARRALERILAAKDPCTECSEVRDPDCYWDGRLKFIHAGPCSAIG